MNATDKSFSKSNSANQKKRDLAKISNAGKELMRRMTQKSSVIDDITEGNSGSSAQGQRKKKRISKLTKKAESAVHDNSDQL